MAIRTSQILALTLLLVGCGNGGPSTVREIATAPALFWEKAKECRKKELSGRGTECEIVAQELQTNSDQTHGTEDK